MINVLRLVTQERARIRRQTIAGAQCLARPAAYGFILGNSGLATPFDLHSATWSLHEFLNFRLIHLASVRLAANLANMRHFSTHAMNLKRNPEAGLRFIAGTQT
jgi:hypothetical protein